MNMIGFIKKNSKLALIILILSSIFSVVFLRKLGIKDSMILFASNVLLLTSLSLLKYNMRNSLLLFILSFPVIVNARKITYGTLSYFSFNYETVYIIAAFIFSLINYKEEFKKIFTDRRNRFNTVILVFLMFCLNSIIFSENYLVSFNQLLLAIIVPAMFYFMCLAFFRREDISRIYYALIIGLDLSVIYGFVQAFGVLKSTGALSRTQITFGYHNVNVFCGVLLLVSPFIIYLLLFRRNTRREIIFLIFSYILAILALGLSFTRGAIIAFGLSFIMMLYDKKYRKFFYVVLGLGIIVTPKAAGYIMSRGGAVGSLLTNESAVARIESIFTGFRIMLTYPLGIGPGNFPEMFKRFLIDGYMLIPRALRNQMYAATYVLESAHNLWLQIGVEYGIPALVTFIILLLRYLKFSFKNIKRTKGCFVAIIMYIIYGAVTGIEFNHKGVITATLILWMIFAIIGIENRESEYETSN